MDYRFTMTTRMIALSVISVLLLLGLLFALGFQIGQQWANEEALKRPGTAPNATATPPSAPASATPVAATPR